MPTGEGVDETTGELAEALVRLQAAREALEAAEWESPSVRARLAEAVRDAEEDAANTWHELRGMMGGAGESSAGPT